MENPNNKRQGNDDNMSEYEKSTHEFFKGLGISKTLPEPGYSGDFYSKLIGGALTVDHISRGHVTCSFSVLPCLTNFYHGLHGGAVAAVAQRLAIACARTVVAKDKDLFLGELTMSYLSASPTNAALIVDASLLKTGRNLSVIAIEFKLKPTLKLVYTAQATFFHLPASRL